MEAFLNKTGDWEGECKKVAESLHKFGILIVRDPRVDHKDNDTYIDMMERYFESRGKMFYKGEELKDAHPELSYQTGVTPESCERARDHAKVVAGLPADSMPMSPFPPELDAKWRFFWAIGKRPAETKDELPQTYPEGFPEWEENMDKWGNFMIEACFTSAQMAAVGMGLE
jgi:hypothetical protein